MNKTRTILIAAATTLGVFLAGGVVYGYEQADLDTLHETNQCAQCDLSGADLSGMDLKGTDLDGTNLSGATLRNANLSNADASGVNLSKANLNGTNLTGADLSGSDLSDADLTAADTTKTNFSGVKLDNATWTDGSRCKAGSIETCDKEEKK